MEEDVSWDIESVSEGFEESALAAFFEDAAIDGFEEVFTGWTVVGGCFDDGDWMELTGRIAAVFELVDIHD